MPSDATPSATPSAALASIWRHPVKGLTPERLAATTLRPGGGIAGDRAYALLFEDAPDAARPGPEIPFQTKNHLATQMDWPGLARLRCRYGTDVARLEISLDGAPVLSEPLPGDATARARVSAFFTAYLPTLAPSPGARHPRPAPVRLIGVPAAGSRYPDRQRFDLSILNLASLRELERRVGAAIDVRRFRGNLVLDGVPAWEETRWAGRTLRIGDARIELKAPIRRCVNVDVHPERGLADLPVFATLARERGQPLFGMMADVTRAGDVREGDAVT